jgi:hypothetical protein
MKKLYLWCLSAVLISFASCKKDGFLGQTQTTNLSKTTVFADSANTVAFLSNIYSNVGFSFNPGRFLNSSLTTNGGLDAASDEAEVSSTTGSTALAFETGTINAAVVTDDAYKTCYYNIRAVNQFLKNLPGSPIKAFSKSEYKAEARFLRAWYYAILLKHYGGVPLIGDTIYTYTDHIPAKRSTYADCVNYITSECDSAAQVLPMTQVGLNYGRASKGACLALKSRVLLYAASPLFNGTTLASGDQAQYVGYPTADPNRWKLAEDAAAAVISSGAYSLNVDNTTPGNGFQQLFTLRYNSEYIFPLMRGSNVDFESLWDPPSRTGKNGAFPLQGLVDAFPMSNGLAITDPNSGYDPQNPYANRDPRLSFTVIHDQTQLQNRLESGFSPVNIFIGTYNGISTGPDAVGLGTRTGYYTNKMMDPNAVANDFTHVSNRCWPLMRYAEILLNYAEAANENDGPTALVYQAIESIRQRAGLSPYQLPVGLTQDQMRAEIQNERRIELAFEEQRFWDVRRWKIANQTENIITMGMEVDRNGSSVTYKEFQVRQRNFRPAMYLWPFPQSEVAKSPELTQNPGY